MVLKDSLYSIQKKQQQESAVCYDLALHADHFIYQAHFPGEPITPGVCVIQMAKELLEDHLQRPLAVSTVKNVKFLNVISPALPCKNPQLQYLIDYRRHLFVRSPILHLIHSRSCIGVIPDSPYGLRDYNRITNANSICFLILPVLFSAHLSVL